jgi:hypothetical protein
MNRKRRSILIEVSLLLAATAMPSPVRSQQQPESESRRYYGISAGMGVGALSAASVTDYINAVVQPPTDQRLEDFTSAVELFVAPEFQVADQWSVAFEYSLLLKSYSLSSVIAGGTSEFHYQVHMPTAIVHYLMPGNGYWIKLGGGIGYHAGTLTQSLFGGGFGETFKAGGVGVKLEAIGNTKFDESFYGSIGVDLRWGSGGNFTADDGAEATFAGNTADLSFFNIGLKLGVVFLF